MRTEHLEYLVAAARHGSMRQAAKSLYCSQPTISGAVESLENELGFQLLERTASGVIPTAKGGMIIDDAEQIVRMVKSWTDDQRDLGENLSQVKFMRQMPEKSASHFFRTWPWASMNAIRKSSCTL